MPRVFDTFPFFNEFDMLELREKTLAGLVDLHVANTSRLTHAGKSNPYVADYVLLADEWSNRKEGGPLTVFTHNWSFEGPEVSTTIDATRRREMWQRNSISWNLMELANSNNWTMGTDDIILLSDADEIPNPDLVRHLREHGLEEGHVMIFRQRMCYYDLNTTQGYIWQGTRAVRWRDFFALTPHVVRYGLGQHDQHYPKYIVAQPGGWHLSYFGGPQKVQEKMVNFLHQELVTAENTQQDTIAQRIAAGADIWGRDGHDWQVERTRDVPPPVLDNPKRWRHLWRPGYEPEDE
jgi:beta-1,4-mannosyl-glycoprotein beta-1,4-N-acetylglucosaminyltransferase